MQAAEGISKLPVFKEVDGHFHPAPFYLSEEMFGGLDVEIAGGPIDHLVNQPVADVHTHDVPEIYLLLSPEPGGAKIRIEVDGETHVLESPANFYVPAGARHRFLTLEATKGSYCLGLLLNYQRKK
ncbi:MAG TPA: cupin domain-containing protein [Bacilli bacterium]|nr:cupin domain-containing protein [Bacilli bacterium]